MVENFWVLCWLIWFDVNKHLKEGSSSSPCCLIAEAEAYLAAFDKCYGDGIPSSNPSPRSWLSPLAGFVKLNSDATMDIPNKRVEVGCIVRDSLSLAKAFVSKRFSHCSDVSIAGAIAIREGLSFAIRTGLKKNLVESDSKVVIDWLLSSPNVMAPVGISYLLLLRWKCLLPMSAVMENGCSSNRPASS